MDKEKIANYKKAGEITAEVQELAAKKLKVGANLFEFAEEIEGAIKKKGGFPAFPINLSRNHVAAHYTPAFESKDEVAQEDVIKVDIGVHVEGFIADSARTIDFSGKHTKMVKAAQAALEKAVSLVKEGLVIGEMGQAVEDTIKAAGFNPIQNLSGHGVDEYDAHTAPTIPNVGSKDSRELENDMAFAIEPFATDGKGFVREGTQAEIFQLLDKKPVRSADARKILDFVDENYDKLPFAERWLQRELKLSEFGRKVAMRELMQKKCIMAFPLLKEEEGKTVTQAETTLLLNEGKVIRLL
ncbi:MAG TPA: type II methionyl aminopeptidase [archaeon]|nr:type II methionyl aminopeptidase [archaeon]